LLINYLARLEQPYYYNSVIFPKQNKFEIMKMTYKGDNQTSKR